MQNAEPLKGTQEWLDAGLEDPCLGQLDKGRVRRCGLGYLL